LLVKEACVWYSTGELGECLHCFDSMTVRGPAVAGTFYPAEPEALVRAVHEAVAVGTADAVPAKAIVAPHAGYRYSGAIAGSSYRSVAHLKHRVTRVILIGPSHYMSFPGIAAPSATGFQTPLGTISVDRAALKKVLGLPGVQLFDAPFDGEHALEVELPFIQALFPRASVVPLLVGAASVAAVERVLEELWGGTETLIVISSDLSHYHGYEAARALDLGTSRAIEVLAADGINADNACGHRALAGLLRRAAKLDLRATTRDLRNSGDTSGRRDRVVGYGAYTFEDALHSALSEGHRQQLIEAAHATLRNIDGQRRPPAVDATTFALPLRAVRKTFVSIEVNGRLRGCIGSLAAVKPLISDVVDNSFKAAMEDPRVPPTSAEERAQAKISVAILSHMRPVPFASEDELLDALRPEIDGLVICDGDRRALFLPKVWESVQGPREFLDCLKHKAGMPTSPLSREAKAYRFTAETFTG
jgi:AmmeMemoRadiSam system protein B/AmmeMemoRadiSam system protein A